jgi:hypothetical protein
MHEDTVVCDEDRLETVATGYGEDVIPDRFREVVRFEKPYNMNTLLQQVSKLCRETTA